MLCRCENLVSRSLPASFFPVLFPLHGFLCSLSGLHLFLERPGEKIMCVMGTAGSSRTVYGGVNINFGRTVPYWLALQVDQGRESIVE